MHAPLLIRPPAVFTAFCLLLLATGCNVFEGLYEAGTSDEPDVLLEDARYALRNGEPDEAVVYLERAFAIDSTHASVRVELAAALLQAHDIDLLVLKDLADFMAEPPDALSEVAVSPMTAVCNYVSKGGSALKFERDPAYTTLAFNAPVLKRGLALLRPEALEAGLADLTDLQLGTVYLVRAIARLAGAVVRIKTIADALGVSFYRTAGGIGFCAPSQSALDKIESFVLCAQVPSIGEAITDLTLRQSLLGRGPSSATDEVLEAANDVRNSLAGSIMTTCSDPR